MINSIGSITVIYLCMFLYIMDTLVFMVKILLCCFGRVGDCFQVQSVLGGIH